MSTYVELDVEEIEADSEWNSRSGSWEEARGDEQEHTFLELIESIRSEKQHEPVTVQPSATQGKYKLVAGFRRFTAIARINRELAADAKKRKVRAFLEELTPLDAAIRNVGENASRQGLRLPDLAWGIHRAVSLYDSKVKMLERYADVARRIGMHVSYVTQLASISSKLRPDVFQSWRASPMPLTFLAINDVAKKPLEEQPDAYREKLFAGVSKEKTKARRKTWVERELKNAELVGRTIGKLVNLGIAQDGVPIDSLVEFLCDVPAAREANELEVLAQAMRRAYERGRTGKDTKKSSQ